VLNSTNSSTIGNLKLFTELHNASLSLSRNIASNVMRVGDEVSDVTSVNTVLQLCTGKVVRLNIQLEITVVEFNSHGTGSSDGAM
jgi:hypothetical protein